MAEKTGDRRSPSRLEWTRFARILLTMGSGASPWLMGAFILGVIAVGVLSNFVFSAVYEPSAVTVEGAARVGLAVLVCVLAGYLAYRIDLSRAWQAHQWGPRYHEHRARPHAGLIWLLSPHDIDFPLTTILYHHEAAGGPIRQHCWVLVTSTARPAYEQLAARIDELHLEVTLHPVALEAETLEATSLAVERIYQAEAAQVGLRAEQIIADMTGGLKPMTAGLVLVCVTYGYALEYIESQHDAEGRVIKGTQVPVKVDVDLTRRPRA
jgi:hypothetical protein